MEALIQMNTRIDRELKKRGVALTPEAALT